MDSIDRGSTGLGGFMESIDSRSEVFGGGQNRGFEVLGDSGKLTVLWVPRTRSNPTF